MEEVNSWETSICFGILLRVPVNIEITKSLRKVLLVRFSTYEEDAIMLPLLYECHAFKGFLLFLW